MRPSHASLAILLSLATAAAAEQPAAPARFTATTEVVASRGASTAEDTGRRVVVLERDEIRRLPVHDLQGLLAVLPGLGVVRRGARGVEADLGVRGATFEQVAVLVNGVRVNNPQTGHLTLDLFLPLDAIERVEVLYGPGSALYGPDAFAGAINIVTAAPPSRVEGRAGSHRLAGGSLAGPLAAGVWAALERETHSGFRDDTEASHNAAAAGWIWRSPGAAEVEIMAAGGERHFGAFRFYSQAFPMERDRTSGGLLTVTAVKPLGGGTVLRAAARASRHRDVFTLDRSRPDWYQNRHWTRGGLLDVVLAHDRGGSWWAVGGEGSRDELDSSSLGRHHRLRSALFAEVGRRGSGWSGGVQGRVDHQEAWGTVTTLAAGGSVVLRRWTVRIHHGQSFRAPSFTELYYDSPATVGDPGLEPERGRTSEVGLARGPLSLTVFARNAHPVIDFVRGEDEVWRATALGAVRTRGVELSLTVPAAGPLRMQRLGLAWLHTSADLDRSRSRYALTHPRLEAVYSGWWEPHGPWRVGWTARFRDPSDAGSWATLDLACERRIVDGVTLTLEAANLLDRRVEELDGVPLPGRWVTVSLAWQGAGR